MRFKPKLPQHAFVFAIAIVWPYIAKLGVGISMLVLSYTMASADVITIIILSFCVTGFLVMAIRRKANLVLMDDCWVSGANSHAGSDQFLVIDLHPGHNRDSSFPLRGSTSAGRSEKLIKYVLRTGRKGTAELHSKHNGRITVLGWDEQEIRPFWSKTARNCLIIQAYRLASLRCASLCSPCIWINWMTV